jgi:hypothetical protein
MNKPTVPSQRVKYVAVGGEVDHYGSLPPDAVAQFEAINRDLAHQWNSADAENKALPSAASGCLTKLSTALFQVQRMKSHHDWLLEVGRDNRADLEKQENAVLALQGKEACADFEGLLLQGRAALDRLTFFLSHQFFPNSQHKSDRFSKLLGSIKKTQSRHPHMAAVERLFTEAEWLVSFFTDARGRSLRSSVAHRVAVLEWMDTCFTIARVPDGRVLLFDGVVNDVPIFVTSQKISAQLAFVVLNCIGLFTTGVELPLASYTTPWPNQTVVLSDFVSDTKTPLLQAVAKRMTPGGFDFQFQYLRDEILNHAVALGQ